MVVLLVALVFGLLVLIPIGLIILLLTCAAQAATITVGCCHRCGYDLRLLRHRRRCPECGEIFDVDKDGMIISGMHNGHRR